MRNRVLQALLFDDGEAEVEPDQRRRRSAAMSRRLRILRAHGIIQKVQRTHRYHVTIAGRTILAAVITAARVTLNQLDRLYL